MQSLVYVVGVAALLGSCAVGLLAHELSHALVLRAAGVSHTVEVLPNRGTESRLPGVVGGPLARVRPTTVPDHVSPWALRCAALMPLLLASPLALIIVGAFPDPFAADALWAQLAVVGWLGCSIPSPRDFSIAWYPERALAVTRDRGEGSPTEPTGPSNGT